MNAFTQNVMAFINSHFGGNIDDTVANSASLPDPASTFHRSDDDLRTGPFKYVTSAGRLLGALYMIDPGEKFS
jgi:hypothetical protein